MEVPQYGLCKKADMGKLTSLGGGMSAMASRGVRSRFSLLRVLSGMTFLLLLALPGSLSAKNVHKLSFRDLEGHQAKMKDFDGRIVVLNFWATWCGPCRAELPRLAELSQQYPSSKISFILLSVDEKGKLEQVRKFAIDQKLTLPVWVGANIEQLEEYSGVNIVPATLIVDEHGEIVRAINGEAQPDDIKQAVDWLLNGRQGESPSLRVKRY